MRICFLNPFGTDAFDGIIEASLAPYLRADVELAVVHLEGCPRNMDYYVPKHLAEEAVLRSVVEADRAGFDAFVIGCCYDPGLTQARELTDMPVVGPLEASIGLARPFGHRFAVVTDHAKALPQIADTVRLYGAEPNCTSVRAIDWFIDDMIQDPAAVAADALAKCEEVMDRDGAETVILGCTIIAACYEQQALAAGPDAPLSSIINPNLMALKVAEVLGDLHRQGQYRISRRGYYQQHRQHDAAEAREVMDVLMGAPAPAS
jgi:allantoin racemase